MLEMETTLDEDVVNISEKTTEHLEYCIYLADGTAAGVREWLYFWKYCCGQNGIKQHHVLLTNVL